MRRESKPRITAAQRIQLQAELAELRAELDPRVLKGLRIDQRKADRADLLYSLLNAWRGLGWAITE